MPVTVVTFALGRLDDCRLTTNVVLTGFLAAGTIGVVVSAVTEIYLLPTGAGPLGNALGFFGVGLIEEVSKGAVLVAVAWRVRERTVHGGMVLGATVGAGFSAFESTGYAFYAYVQHTDDHPELNILQTEVSRAMLAPFGHLTWTALLGGALFAVAAPPNGGFRFTSGWVGRSLGSPALHGAWDASYGWAIWITQGLIGSGWIADWPDGSYWEVVPTQQELWVFQADVRRRPGCQRAHRSDLGRPQLAPGQKARRESSASDNCARQRQLAFGSVKSTDFGRRTSEPPSGTERVTGIEPAWPAWKAPSKLTVRRLTCAFG